MSYMISRMKYGKISFAKMQGQSVGIEPTFKLAKYWMGFSSEFSTALIVDKNISVIGEKS